MNTNVTIQMGNLSSLTEKHIPSWTLPFVVEQGEREVTRAENSNLRLIQSEDGAVIENAHENAFEQEFGSTSIQASAPLGLLFANGGE